MLFTAFAKYIYRKHCADVYRFHVAACKAVQYTHFTRIWFDPLLLVFTKESSSCPILFNLRKNECDGLPLEVLLSNYFSCSLTAVYD